MPPTRFPVFPRASGAETSLERWSKSRQVLVDGNLVSARTVMADRFHKELAYTPIGTVPPNGQEVQWELINIFRFTDEGRLVEEWVQTDTYGFLRQLGAVAS
jgi:predicted ester cyclase